MITETALIAAPSRADNRIFGRPLLERLIISCERAGISRFIIEAPPARRAEIEASLGCYRNHPTVTLVDRLDAEAAKREQIDPTVACIALSGNLVFFKSQLEQVLSEAANQPGSIVRLTTSDSDHGGEIAAGPCAELLRRGGMSAEHFRRPRGDLPFALNGRPEDREEAEVRLARSLRIETAKKDAPMARWVDRKLSWRLSLRLARTAITPNQVTIANTILGLTCGWMFAVPGYWTRVAAAILFLISITIDGVDGELARLKMCETKFGGKLDVVTDNIVHVAVFVGIYVGCYRASGSIAYLWLTLLVLGGFGLCSYATYRAFALRGEVAEKWLEAVDRWSGRDFAYLLVVLALINRIEWFAWGTAFGTYLFAFGLIWLVARKAPENPGPDARLA
ncbi:MAG: CDP-alcohol phosphatidyltransferase family protein [Candidatus Binataceae bacterium]